MDSHSDRNCSNNVINSHALLSGRLVAECGEGKDGLPVKTIIRRPTSLGAHCRRVETNYNLLKVKATLKSKNVMVNRL